MLVILILMLHNDIFQRSLWIGREFWYDAPQYNCDDSFEGAGILIICHAMISLKGTGILIICHDNMQWYFWRGFWNYVTIICHAMICLQGDRNALCEWVDGGHCCRTLKFAQKVFILWPSWLSSPLLMNIQICIEEPSIYYRAQP